MRVISVACLIILVFFSCTNNKGNERYFQLTKYSIPEKAEVDTLENDSLHKFKILGVTVDRPLGKYEYYYVVEYNKKDETIYFKIEKGNLVNRLSKNSIALVEPYGVKNWGWFTINQKEITGRLPNDEKIIDSLRSLYPADYLLSQRNGHFTIYNNGSLVGEWDYSQFALGYPITDIEDLESGLYKLESSFLRKVSTNPNDLFKQKAGVFYVPLPGYGVSKEISKLALFKALDSLANLNSYPEAFSLPAIPEEKRASL